MTDTLDHPAASPADGFSRRARTGLLVLADGTVFEGTGFGAETKGVGEVCFNTAMTGYQEILTDPSYAGQIVAFTFPHIGIVGTNSEDIESLSPVVRGLVVRADAENPSNYRALAALDRWLKNQQHSRRSPASTRARSPAASARKACRTASSRTRRTESSTSMRSSRLRAVSPDSKVSISRKTSAAASAMNGAKRHGPGTKVMANWPSPRGARSFSITA